MSEPEAGDLTDLLVEAALSRLKGQSGFSCRVFSFAENVNRVLVEHGFRTEGEFTLLAKPIAATVAAPPLAQVVPA
jgi:hypothetical protein